MRRSDFYHSSSKFLVNIRICNQADYTAGKRKLKFFSNDRLVTLIFWIYSNRSIAKQSFRTGCGNFNFSRAVFKFIINVIHEAVCVCVLNFIISKSSSAARTPVYKIVSFIDKAALIKSNKNIANSLRKAFVHCKTLAVPVNGISKLALLFNNCVMMVFLYLPSALKEFFTSKVIAGLSLFFKLLFNNILSGNSCMVSSRNPKSVVAFHSVVAHNNILQCIVQPVPHMKNTCNIWRRNYDRIL